MELAATYWFQRRQRIGSSHTFFVLQQQIVAKRRSDNSLDFFSKQYRVTGLKQGKELGSTTVAILMISGNPTSRIS